MIRLQKYLSNAGVASRRHAEELIAKGFITVNGEVITEMGTQVDENGDTITYKGKVVKLTEKKEYIMLNKPVGYITTVSDDKNRKTIMELVSDIPGRIYPVGRLDYETEGLLFMTNDGDLTYKLTHPKNNVNKVYIAEVTGNITMEKIEKLRMGVFIEDERTSPAKVEVVGATQHGARVEITIHEGRNHQVRNMFEAVDLKVIKLKRIAEAGLVLGNLPLGKWRRLNDNEVRFLQKCGQNKSDNRRKKPFNKRKPSGGGKKGA